MKKVFIYIRVSTDEQADKGYSQRSQEEYLIKFCELNNLTIVGAYFEDYSAKNFERPEFKKLLIMLKKQKGLVDMLLFTKWDRFSRNAGDAYAMINQLNKLGVEPQAIEQPLNLEIPENKMMLAFYLAAPEVENDRRALNTFNGMRRAKKEGRYMGFAPFGYTNKISENGIKYIAIDEKKAGIVRWIFEKLNTGNFTAESIWKSIVEQGYRISKSSFWSLIKNALYAGIIIVPEYKGEPEVKIKGTHEPIISYELFSNVQNIINGKNKLQRTKIFDDSKFPLRGFIKCTNCGKLLTASTSKGRSNYYSYYHCTSSCGVRFSSEFVNDEFVSELRKWVPQKGMIELFNLILVDVMNQLNATSKQDIMAIKEQVAFYTNKKKKSLQLYIDERLDHQDYNYIKIDCEKNLLILEEKLISTTLKKNNPEELNKALDIISNIDYLYTNSCVSKKKEIIGSIFTEKLEFTNYGFRTAKINEVVNMIYNVGKAFEKIKMVQTSDFSSLYQEVP